MPRHHDKIIELQFPSDPNTIDVKPGTKICWILPDAVPGLFKIKSKGGTYNPFSDMPGTSYSHSVVLHVKDDAPKGDWNYYIYYQQRNGEIITIDPKIAVKPKVVRAEAIMAIASLVLLVTISTVAFLNYFRTIRVSRFLEKNNKI